MSTNPREMLHRALATVPVIDPHCHLRLNKPAADNLADILLYHHIWSELVSSGMPAQAVTHAGLPHELADPEMPPWERVRRALPYLRNIRNTTLGLLLRWLLYDLYGVEELNERNLERVFALAQARADDPAWQEEVLRAQCGIETSITVELVGEPYAPQMRQGKEGLLGWLVVYGKRSLAEWWGWVESAAGRELRNAADYREHLARSVQQLPIAELHFVGLHAPAALSHERATDEEVTRTLRQIREGQPVDHAQVGGLAYFGMRCVLAALQTTPLRTIQFFAGAELLPPVSAHRSVSHGGEGFCGALGRLAVDYPEFEFNVSLASDLYTQDLNTLAKHVPNISVAGYWWHTLYPFYIRKAIETRLDMVPMNKIVMFFSDAYHAEWCYPKLKLVKAILEDVLVERVEKGWYSVDLALDIIQATFYENPKRDLPAVANSWYRPTRSKLGPRLRLPVDTLDERWYACLVCAPADYR